MRVPPSRCALLALHADRVGTSPLVLAAASPSPRAHSPHRPGRRHRCCCCAIYEGTKIWTIVLLCLTRLGVIGNLSSMSLIEEQCAHAQREYATAKKNVREFADKCYNKVQKKPVPTAARFPGIF